MSIITHYADLLFQIASSDTKNVEVNLGAFLRLVQTRGHKKLLSKILREFERKIVQRSKQNIHTLTVARKEDVGEARRELEALNIDSGATEVNVVVDDNIVGGFQYRKNDLIVDNSHRKALLHLYKRLTV